MLWYSTLDHYSIRSLKATGFMRMYFGSRTADTYLQLWGVAFAWYSFQVSLVNYCCHACDPHNYNQLWPSVALNLNVQGPSFVYYSWDCHIAVLSPMFYSLAWLLQFWCLSICCGLRIPRVMTSLLHVTCFGWRERHGRISLSWNNTIWTQIKLLRKKSLR